MKKELNRILNNLELLQHPDFLDEYAKNNILIETIKIVKKLYEVN